MTDYEQAIRNAIADEPIQGPWQVWMGRDKHGCTGYRILTHSHAAICVAAEDYYAPGHFPETDDDGYYQPDARMDCFAHRVATARYIAATNPQAIEALVRELDVAREHAKTWEQRAKTLGWIENKLPEQGHELGSATQHCRKDSGKVTV
jgi:hypothetical protein